jgi:hypothetical protein
MRRGMVLSVLRYLETLQLPASEPDEPSGG